jgi:hypothetical protein
MCKHCCRDELTIDIVYLRRPEEKHHEVVAAAEEGDEQDDDHRLLSLAEQRPRYHRVRCIHLPNKERYDEDDTDDKGSNVVRASPCILSQVSGGFS